MITTLLHPVRRALAVRQPATADPPPVLAFPRDPNPYLELLYGELRRRGADVAYIGRATSSQSLNALLLPAELALGRLRGARASCTSTGCSHSASRGLGAGARCGGSRTRCSPRCW